MLLCANCLCTKCRIRWTPAVIETGNAATLVAAPGFWALMSVVAGCLAGTGYPLWGGGVRIRIYP
jgi:hypothetical protein